MKRQSVERKKPWWKAVTIPPGLVVQVTPPTRDYRHSVKPGEAPAVFAALRLGEYLP